MEVFVLFAVLCSLLSIGHATACHSWKSGKIVLEEAYAIPNLTAGIRYSTPPIGLSMDELVQQFVDLGPTRLAKMNRLGIQYMVISHTAPGPQAMNDSAVAEFTASWANDYLYQNIKNNTDRFGAFAMLSMHNATQAAGELERVVKKYGFLGGMVYDYQSYGNGDFQYYDDPSYDVFWAKLVELDVPLYLHPRPTDAFHQKLYLPNADLAQALNEFSNSVSTHLLRFMVAGIFDRFPTLKIIVGHMGEHLPSDFIRQDQQFANDRAYAPVPFEHNVTYYFKQNIWETTSGNFNTDLLQMHLKTLGVDHILYSVDYPYAPLEDGNKWFEGLEGTIDIGDLTKISRGNSIDLMRLQFLK